MNKFMKHYKIFLTPLSPIHIGCGEDFEPTNYVIKDQVLYHFDPSRIYLSPAQRDELKNHALRIDLLGIQSFFKKNAEKVASLSHYIVDVVNGVATEWEDRIGKVAQKENNGNEVIAKLSIERNAYSTYSYEPYIPGSSFKGALATALLNEAHKKHGHSKNKLENKELLKKYLGEFADSKLRLVKFADFTPINHVQSKVYYSLNLKKDINNNAQGRGLPLRRECIMAGQYHAFRSELSLWEEAPFSIDDLLKSLNDYYKEIFKEEGGQLINKGLINKTWFNQVSALLDKPNIALLRLGKNGADSKIYRTKGMARIKIMRKKGSPNDFKDRSTTLWLAGHQKDQYSELHPFGWALLELDNGQENDALKKWCAQQSASHSFNKQEFLLRQQVIKEEEERKLQKLAEEKRAKEAQRLAEEEALRQKEEQRAKELASVNENQAQVLAMLNTLEDIEKQLEGSQRPPQFEQLEALCEAAQNWGEEDKAFLIEKITLNKVSQKIRLSKKAEKKFKAYGLKKS